MLRVLLAVSLVGAALGPAPMAHAKADSGLTITTVRLSRTNLAVTGLNTVPVTVEAEGGYDSATADPNLKLRAGLGRDSGAGQAQELYSTAMTRYSGTTQHGKWRGVIHVPSTANGVFFVYGMGTGFKPNGELIDFTQVSSGPKLAVKGTNQPRLSGRVTPAVVPVGKPYTVNWRVINYATNQPYGAKLKAVVGVGAGCARQQGRQVISDVLGNFSQPLAAGSVGQLHCLIVPNDPFPIARMEFYPRRLGVVAAAPLKAAVPAGASVPVNGTITGAPYPCSVQLQRLQGSGQWRTASTGLTRSSGRFTVTAPPVSKGSGTYRVSFSACANFAAAVSKTFPIRGV
ncbi:hypothetical protein [Kribbella sp. NPDC051718]|uniref:hypothetical protein n=1 Tax=Kribbella sp. NPDC051718 TaxID=3155168 RepID=UPI00342F8350